MGPRARLLDDVLKKHCAVRPPHADNCLDLLLGPERAVVEGEGAMVLTPGWIRAWPRIMDAMGWEAADVRMNLGRYSSVVVYDAGVEPLSDDEVLRFFELSALYVDVRPLDLGYFGTLVANLMLMGAS